METEKNFSSHHSNVIAYKYTLMVVSYTKDRKTVAIVFFAIVQRKHIMLSATFKQVWACAGIIHDSWHVRCVHSWWTQTNSHLYVSVGPSLNQNIQALLIRMLRFAKSFQDRFRLCAIGFPHDLKTCQKKFQNFPAKTQVLSSLFPKWQPKCRILHLSANKSSDIFV